MKRKQWLLVAIALIILVLGAMGQRVTQRNWQTELEANYLSRFNREIIETGDITRQIAVLEVNGMIIDNGEAAAFDPTASYNHQATLKQIEEVKNDNTIKALLLVIDSPGGTTYHSVELYRALADLKAAREIPIYVSMGTQAASGGYMIAMAGDKLFADNETTTGSIGVIANVVNFDGFMEKYGFEMYVYKSGENKDMGSAYRQPTDGEKKIYQELIDEKFNSFVEIVAAGRGMSAGDVRKLADGRIYTGTQAQANGLIDEIGYQADALSQLKADHELAGAQVVSVTPVLTTNFFTDYFMEIKNALSANQPQLPASEYDVMTDVLENPEQLQTYYMVGGV